MVTALWVGKGGRNPRGGVDLKDDLLTFRRASGIDEKANFDVALPSIALHPRRAPAAPFERWSEHSDSEHRSVGLNASVARWPTQTNASLLEASASVRSNARREARDLQPAIAISTMSQFAIAATDHARS
jgi:hypothetical protein